MARRVRKSRAGLQRWNQMVAALRDMNFAFTNVRLYPPTHTEVNSVIQRLHEGLGSVLAEQDDVGLGFMDQMLYIEGAMSIDETRKNEMLVERFSKCRVKYLTIMKNVTKEDLLAFFTLLNDESKKDVPSPPGEAVAAKGIKSIHVVEAEVSDTASKAKLGRRTTLLDWYYKAVEILKPVHERMRTSPDADIKPLYRLADDLMATVRTKGYEPFLLLPHLAPGKDPHIEHSVNAAITCCALGVLKGLNSGQIQSLCMAALLHDLGRCIIPLEWTRNPSPLSLFERAVAHQHSAWSFLLLTRNGDVPMPFSLLGARHHANPMRAPENGGYQADTLHRILHLADSYDLASYSDRFYWKKQPPHRMIRRILRGRGKSYSTMIPKVLAQLVGYYPVGSMVRLDDGQKGIVVRAEPTNLLRPKVYLFEAPPPKQDKPLEEGGEPPPAILDLMDLDERGLAFRHSIEGVITPEPGQVRALLDKKKEYLLSFAL